MSCLERDASSHFVNPKRELKNENLDLEVTRIRDSAPLSYINQQATLYVLLGTRRLLSFC